MLLGYCFREGANSCDSNLNHNNKNNDNKNKKKRNPRTVGQPINWHFSRLTNTFPLSSHMAARPVFFFFFDFSFDSFSENIRGQSKPSSKLSRICARRWDNGPNSSHFVIMNKKKCFQKLQLHHQTDKNRFFDRKRAEEGDKNWIKTERVGEEKNPGREIQAYICRSGDGRSFEQQMEMLFGGVFVPVFLGFVWPKKRKRQGRKKKEKEKKKENN